MKIHLTDKKCVACEGGIPPLTLAQMAEFLPEVPAWQVAPDTLSMSRDFTFKTFRDAMLFAIKIGDVAEEEGHHPVLTVSWGKVSVFLTTDAIKGLSENDFILAAKIDALLK